MIVIRKRGTSPSRRISFWCHLIFEYFFPSKMKISTSKAYHFQFNRVFEMCITFLMLRFPVTSSTNTAWISTKVLFFFGIFHLTYVRYLKPNFLFFFYFHGNIYQFWILKFVIIHILFYVNFPIPLSHSFFILCVFVFPR